jgi:hypothetical protein
MKKEKLLLALEDIAKTLNLKVRQEKGDFAGGSCVKDDEPIILLNKRHMIDKRINVLARELASFDLSGIEIPRPVMDVIDSERKRASEIEAELEDSEE